MASSCGPSRELSPPTTAMLIVAALLVSSWHAWPTTTRRMCAMPRAPRPPLTPRRGAAYRVMDVLRRVFPPPLLGDLPVHHTSFDEFGHVINRGTSLDNVLMTAAAGGTAPGVMLPTLSEADTKLIAEYEMAYCRLHDRFFDDFAATISEPELIWNQATRMELSNALVREMRYALPVVATALHFAASHMHERHAPNTQACRRGTSASCCSSMHHCVERFRL